jgi:heat shock protein HtpX
MNNTIKTIILLGSLSLIVIMLGRLFGGVTGMTIAFVFALAMNGVAYFFSDKMALMASGAQPLEEKDAPELYKRTRALAQKAEIPMPRMYITPELQTNAFATGRNPQNSAVAVTQGLLNNLTMREVEAVIAHELAHIKNRDILISSIAAVLASVISFIANMAIFAPNSGDDQDSSPFSIVGAIAMSMLAPIAGMIIQMAISRAREFEADATAKRLLGTGQPLADALMSINRSVNNSPAHDLNPAYASMYIANPFGGTPGALVKLLSTHPPVEERIARLLY